MKKVRFFFKKIWNDPVGSNVIAGVILLILSTLGSILYSIAASVIKSIPIKESFGDVLYFFNTDITIKVGLIILLIIIYLTLIFKPLISIMQSIYNKVITSKTKQPEKENSLPRVTGISTSLFNQRMSSAFPGLRGIAWFDNPKIATDRLEILLQKPLKYKSDSREFDSDPIWWFRGAYSSSIDIFKRTGRKKALMNVSQLKIKRIAAYHGDSYYSDFVYVELDSEKQTGLYNFNEKEICEHIKSRGFSYEEYGVIKSCCGRMTPISRDDYDDRATVKRGKVIDASNSQLRIRYLSKYNFLIAAKGSPYNSRRFITESTDFFNRILKSEIEPSEFFDLLKTYNKHEY